jgi:hypothetical protein
MKLLCMVLASTILLVSGTGASASDETVSCYNKNAFRTIYVSLEPTIHDGIFRAIITEDAKFTYSNPGDPLPVLAEFDDVTHNQHMDLYTAEGFSLLLGDASPARMRVGNLTLDVSCSLNP